MSSTHQRTSRARPGHSLPVVAQPRLCPRTAQPAAWLHRTPHLATGTARVPPPLRAQPQPDPSPDDQAARTSHPCGLLNP